MDWQPCCCGIVGSVLLMSSHAATPTASLEAETARFRRPLAKLQILRLGSQAVKFGDGSSGSSGGFCDSFPALPSTKPVAANTGVPAGTTLTASGRYLGQYCWYGHQCQNVSGGISINANNVTIQNSKITTNGYYGIIIANGVTGTKILDNEIYTTAVLHGYCRERVR